MCGKCSAGPSPVRPSRESPLPVASATSGTSRALTRRRSARPLRGHCVVQGVSRPNDRDEIHVRRAATSAPLPPAIRQPCRSPADERISPPRHLPALEPRQSPSVASTFDHAPLRHARSAAPSSSSFGWRQRSGLRMATNQPVTSRTIARAAHRRPANAPIRSRSPRCQISIDPPADAGS